MSYIIALWLLCQFLRAHFSFQKSKEARKAVKILFETELPPESEMDSSDSEISIKTGQVEILENDAPVEKIRVSIITGRNQKDSSRAG